METFPSVLRFFPRRHRKRIENVRKRGRQKHENAKNVFSTFPGGRWKKYENVEKTFWKRWLYEKVFFQTPTKTFWKRWAVEEVFFHTPTKTFWKRWLF